MNTNRTNKKKISEQVKDKLYDLLLNDYAQVVLMNGTQKAIDIILEEKL